MHWAVAAATNHQGYPFVNGGTTLGPPMAGRFMLFLASVIRSPCLPAVGRPWWDLDGLDGRTGRIWDVGMFYIPTHCIGILAVLRGDSNVKGTVTFEQASEAADTTVSWNISGHDANAERGMHVHAFGDNTNGCTSAGPHCKSPPPPPSQPHTSLYIPPIGDPSLTSVKNPVNPHQKTHGAPSDSERHVGDLGNFKTDGQGNAQGSVTDKLVKLIGPESVLGRTIVVHAGTDDLGQGGNDESKKTGNAGGRPACGVIGIAQ
ncbi:hypothetical protein D0868_12841 [Hortaea werneckii]|nr:hypothetical protein D0868_12841 [Hortaea werneckii]RMX99241.1 hypothetical protein D0866_16078 [Hortaea werneckii]